MDTLDGNATDSFDGIGGGWERVSAEVGYRLDDRGSDLRWEDAAMRCSVRSMEEAISARASNEREAAVAERKDSTSAWLR